MDLSKFESFNISLIKQSAGSGIDVKINPARLAASETDMADAYEALKSQISALPALAGLELAPNGEDVSLNPGQRRISGVLRFRDPNAKPKTNPAPRPGMPARGPFGKVRVVSATTTPNPATPPSQPHAPPAPEAAPPSPEPSPAPAPPSTPAS